MPRVIFRNRLDTDNPPEAAVERSIGAGALRATGFTLTLDSPRTLAIPLGAVRYTGRAPTDITSGGGGGGDIFTADYAAANFPTYGFTSAIAGAGGGDWTRSAASGAGYGGSDALLLTQTPGGNADFGWGNVQTLTPPTQGVVWYLRGRLMISADSDFQGIDQDNSTEIPYSSGKFLLMPGGSVDPSIRVSILWESQHSPTTGFFKLYLGDASGGWQTDYVCERGVWTHWQIEVRSSSVEDADDGEMRIWVNQNTYASPTQVRLPPGSYQDFVPDLVINTSAWTEAGYGRYQNKGLQADGTLEIYHSAFEIGTTFDASWAP